MYEGEDGVELIMVGLYLVVGVDISEEEVYGPKQMDGEVDPGCSTGNTDGQFFDMFKYRLLNRYLGWL